MVDGPPLNRTSLPIRFTSTRHDVLRNAEKKAELLGGPWHRGPSIRGFGDVIPGARSGRSGADGAGRPSWILASSVSRPFSIKPAGLATFHYDNKIYRIWGLEGEKEREGGTHHDAQNATGGERGWMAYLGDHGRRRPRLHGGGRDQIREGDLHFAFTCTGIGKSTNPRFRE